MLKIKLITIASVLSFNFSFAQNDEKAKEILDKLSTQTKSYSTISAEFELTMENLAEDIQETQKGSIVLKNDNYYLKYGTTQVIANHEYKWMVLIDALEVTKEPIEDYDSEDELSPSELFTMYEKGFKYRYNGEETVNGVNCAIIELVPESPDEKSFSRAILHVDIEKNQMVQMMLQGKDGNNHTYKILSFAPNKEFADSYFQFTKSICEECEVLE